VEIGDAAGDHHAFGVVPGTDADPVTGVDRGVTGGPVLAQVRVPRLGTGTRCGRQHLAMAIGAKQAAEIAPLAGTCTGHEKAHRIRGLRLLGGRR